MSGESYVVRIYRRETKGNAQARRTTDRVAIDGIVEEVESGGRSSFHGIEELWDCIARPPGRRARKQRD
jgi:hypothetical protein